MEGIFIMEKIFTEIKTFIEDIKKIELRRVRVRWGNVSIALAVLFIFTWGIVNLTQNTASAISSKFESIKEEVKLQDEMEFNEKYEIIDYIAQEDTHLDDIQRLFLEDEEALRLISKTVELNPHISAYYVPQGETVKIITRR